MAFDDRSLNDYIDVAQRIADFREQHPEGGLQPADPNMPYHVVRVPNGWCRQCIGRRSVKQGRDSWKTCPRCLGSGIRQPDEPLEDVFIVYAAAARRSPDDPHPGVGMAWEPYPGQTPYTQGSELQNAETSAWGRAVIAALASDAKRGVASREEVRNRRAERDDGLPVNRDGSLSRSQTTDEEKDAAGVMTDAQHAEHAELGNGAARGRVPGAKRTRGPIPASDNPWETPAPTYLSAIQMHFKRLGVTNRDERLEKVAALTGHAVPTTARLTNDEQEQLLEVLSKCKNREALDQLAKQETSA